VSYNVNDIKVITGLEAVRKRAGLYFKLDDPLLASKLILTPLQYALEAGVKGQVSLSSATWGTVSWRKALPTELRRGTSPQRQAEALVSQLFAGGPGTNLFENVCSQLAAINGVCEVFEILINDSVGEWGQRYEKGLAVSEFELVGDTTGDHTFIEMQIDETLIPSTFDREFIQKWASEQETEVTTWS